MEHIKSSLNFERFKVIKKTRTVKQNPVYEKAFVLAEKMGMDVKILLVLIKRFGAGAVFELEGWLRESRPHQRNVRYLTAVLKNRITKSSS